MVLVVIAACKPLSKVKVWETGSNPTTFPESELNLPNTGVCFSGGGTRAMSCAIGQMKGLDSLGLWDDIGYISCVSGGSWASTIFTYCDNSISDDELLGRVVAPQKLDSAKLQYLPKTFMGYSVTRDLTKSLVERIVEDKASGGLAQASDAIWIDAIGETYLKPYGIYDVLKPRYFTLNTSTLGDIIKRNPHLKEDDFYLVHNRKGDANRPYLIVNSSMLAPASALPQDTANKMAVFNYTPLYIGSLHGMSVTYQSQKKGNVSTYIGGSLLEPFAFGGGAPKQYQTGNATQELPLSDRKFRLTDATGTSSSAFAATFSVQAMLKQVPTELLLGFSLDGMIPEEKYWTVEDNTLVKEQKFRFADGGNLENYGLLTLLQRKVSRIVVFANSATPLNDCDPAILNPEDYQMIDSDLPQLFGYKWGSVSPNQRNNAVFTKAQFDTLYNRLRKAKLAGKSVMTQMEMTTVQNDWWGIEGGQKVTILWVYNDQVTDWQNQLPKKIRLEIGKGPAGKFANFPFYKTMFENVPHLVEYTPEQMNLLYQLSAWNVYTNPQLFEFLKGN